MRRWLHAQTPCAGGGHSKLLAISCTCQQVELFTSRLESRPVRLDSADIDSFAWVHLCLERRARDGLIGKQDVDGVLSRLCWPVADDTRAVPLIEALDLRLGWPLDRQTEPTGSSLARVDGKFSRTVRNSPLQSGSISFHFSWFCLLRLDSCVLDPRHLARALRHFLSSEHDPHGVWAWLRQREFGTEAVDGLLDLCGHRLAGQTDDCHLHLSTACARCYYVKVDLFPNGNLCGETWQGMRMRISVYDAAVSNYTLPAAETLLTVWELICKFS